MKQSQASSTRSASPSQYWMRAISFAGLHRILNAVGDDPGGLRAKEINELVLNKGVMLTPRNPQPKPTTLYHYRNALLRLQALVRNGQRLCANCDNPEVRAILRLPAPSNGDQSLSNAAREHFAALVLGNNECRTLFFDLFMPRNNTHLSVPDFRKNGIPARWRWEKSRDTTEVVLENETTGYRKRYASPRSVSAILYGLRYWARGELKLIDEYGQGANGGVIMFPVCLPPPSTRGHDAAVTQAMRFLLDRRSADEWTLFSIPDLIADYCQAQRQPRKLLFDAIDRFLREWPRHTILIPTPRALATINVASASQEGLVLRRYYKSSHGPYISHIRLHEDICIETRNARYHHARHASEAGA